MAIWCEKGSVSIAIRSSPEDTKCSSRFFLLITNDDNGPLDGNPIIDTHSLSQEMLDLPQAQSSFYSLSDHLAPETLRLVGRVSNQTVIILINGGNMHNFV